MANFDELPCPALVTDRGGIVQSVNPSLLQLVGGVKEHWVSKPMDLMFPMASRIFLQTHVWPLIFRENQVREIRLQMLGHGGTRVPVLVNCQKSTFEGSEHFTWVCFVSVERSRYEHELLEARQRAETASAALAKSERFIRTVADAMPSMLAYWDSHLRCQFANRPYLEWFGRTPQQMLGLSMPAVLGKALYELNLPHIQSALAGEFQEFERAIVKPDGSVGYTLANYIPDKNTQGRTVGFFALVTNISRLREADAAIRLSASVFEVTTEAIMVTDTQATIVSVNPAFTTLTGYTADEVIGQNARILKSGRHDSAFFAVMFAQLQSNGLWKGDVWSKRKNGTMYLGHLSISAIHNDSGEITRFVGVCSDVTDRWDKEQIVRQMALHDSLTGLPNRSLLMEQLGMLMALSAREPRRIALMFLDLDRFKWVNDTWGHDMGDHVLKTVSSRLSGLLRPSDTVARLGGDEFVILLNNPGNRASVELIASRVIEDVNVPIGLDGRTAHVGASVGITMFQNGDTSPETLLKRADDAMYAAKAAGKNTYRFSD